MMKKWCPIFITALFFAIMPSTARGATPAQETAEKFITFFMNKDFTGAAKMTPSASLPEALAYDIKQLNKKYKNATKAWVDYYAKKPLSGILQKRELEPQTLVSSVYGDKNGFYIFISLTEKHTVGHSYSIGASVNVFSK